MSWVWRDMAGQRSMGSAGGAARKRLAPTAFRRADSIQTLKTLMSWTRLGRLAAPNRHTLTSRKRPMNRLSSSTHPRESSTHERAIEALSRQSHLSIEQVAQLYAHELAVLTAGARITGFLTILTPRKAREILRQRQSSSARLCGTCSLRIPHARRRESPRWSAQDNW
jgi:hypothetical protein